ncbi:MAG: exosortase system-associated protein, TIGR04073 family [Nitrospiria bacterium]
MGRGIVNAGTGWVEFFRGIYDKTIEHDPVTGFLYGSLYGTGMTVVRTVSGVYETVTFLFAVPTQHKSTIEPEFVWQDWKR